MGTLRAPDANLEAGWPVKVLPCCGHGQAADSWVKPGPNQQLAPDQLEQAIAPDVLKALSERKGSRGKNCCRS
jgi:uncharacterized protein YidB (DUF937 family)